jgi:hypothetical protein
VGKEDKKNIIERHTHTLEDGRSMFKIADALLEMEARHTTMLTLINEVKEVLAGFAKWAEETDARLQKVDPKIILRGDKEFDETIKGL